MLLQLRRPAPSSLASLTTSASPSSSSPRAATHSATSSVSRASSSSARPERPVVAWQSGSLDDAINDTILPAVPPRARLPPSFSSSRALSRPPAFFDSLTRSTLPTSSLTSQDLTPTVLNPRRSSIDTLRALAIRDHNRPHPVLQPQAPPPPKPPSPSLYAWWWQKDAVNDLLNEDDREDTIDQAKEGIRRKYRSPKNPVVFCHGLLGFDSVTIGPAIAPLQVAHWRGIKEVLEANGTEVLITRVPATSSPRERAEVLAAAIEAALPGRSVHLVGHSMGGLDCRWLTTHLTARSFRVLSVTTVATPHRGSAFADHFLETVGRTRMPSVLSLLDLLPNGGGDGTAFESLTIASMRKFNEETPDVPGVRYFSWGAEYTPGLIDTWKWPHGVILEKEGPNDGLVSVASSRWGQYMGTLQHVNHLDLVGWVNQARYKWAEIMGKEIKFRPATFYLGVADMLAQEVEGQDGGAGEDAGEQIAGDATT